MHANRETCPVTLTLQLELFIIYTRNDNATYICTAAPSAFQHLCHKKMEREVLYIGIIIVFIRTGNDP